MLSSSLCQNLQSPIPLLWSVSSSVCFTGILVSKQPLWFQISTFAMDFCVYFVHVWSKCSFLSVFFFSFLRISYSYNNMKHITWNKQNCVWQMAGKHITVMWLSLRSKHDIFIKLHKYTHLHVCWITVPHKQGLRLKKKKKKRISSNLKLSLQPSPQSYYFTLMLIFAYFISLLQ